MRIYLTTLIIVLAWTGASAQFSVDKLQVRFGYGIHNARAKNFNDLVTAFNRDRFPLIVSENLPSVNFQHGWTVGGVYTFSEDLFLYGQLRNHKEFLETQYVDSEFFRSYLFRTTTLDAGLMVPIGNEGRIRHLVGGGLSLGVMGIFTDWDTLAGNQGSKDMLAINRSEIIGLNGFYEAQIVLTDHIRFYIKPQIRFALSTRIPKLNQFFNPLVDGENVTFPEGEGASFDKGNLNGMGIEGGLIILLPEM